jgi:hypothetical protein
MALVGGGVGGGSCGGPTAAAAHACDAIRAEVTGTHAHGLGPALCPGTAAGPTAAAAAAATARVAAATGRTANTAPAPAAATA